MKLHDLRPAEGSHRPRTRVGRGIAAGKGKTAGRGTKGQRSRAGSSIPAWFEGGQTPLHIRIPKLRGFRNVNRVEYEVVNVGAIAQAVARGRLAGPEGAPKGRKAAPITVNADLLREAGLVTNLRRPLKILGAGDLDVALFVVADAFTKSAREKIEAVGGTAQLIEIPSEPLAAIGLELADEASAPGVSAEPTRAEGGPNAEQGQPAAEVEPAAEAEPARRKRGKRIAAEDTAAPAEGGEGESPAGSADGSGADA